MAFGSDEWNGLRGLQVGVLFVCERNLNVKQCNANHEPIQQRPWEVLITNRLPGIERYGRIALSFFFDLQDALRAADEAMLHIPVEVFRGEEGFPEAAPWIDRMVETGRFEPFFETPVVSAGG